MLYRETVSALNIQVMINQASRQVKLDNVRDEETYEIKKTKKMLLTDVKKRERILLTLKFIIDTDLLLKVTDNLQELQVHFGQG